MALTPNYLQKCTDGIERQYQQLVTEILVDLADRISHAQGMTSTAEYLNEKLREMSLHQVWINQMLAKVLNTTEKDVEKLMEESTYKSTRSEIKNLEAHGYDTSGLEFAVQIEKSTNVAKNELTNLTRTTGQLATSKLMNIYDQAYLQVSTGAYSYDQAVNNAVKKLAKDGLGEVTYPTGAKRTVEAAVRVAVRTSVSQNALKCEEDMLDDMDVNLVEVSSHLGARPSHAIWQGKIYWRKHPEGNYENFYEATGYGTPTGLGGYNCRHQHYAYFGDDDEQAYHHIDETLNKEAYDMEQKQRSLERKLREWDRKEKILNAGGVDSTEAKRWKSYYKKKLDEHVKSSNGFLKRDYAAEKAWSAPESVKARKMLSLTPQIDSVLKDVSKNAIETSRSFEEYKNYVIKNIPSLRRYVTSEKSEWIKILEKANFRSGYKIARTPSILKNYGIDEDVIMSLSNFAYIMARHSSEYEPDIFLKAKETIEEYDLLLHGEQEVQKDFRFYKLFEGTDGSGAYGIEIVIDKPVISSTEYIVHFNYLGKKKNKALKQYRRLLRNENLIDAKK